MQWNGQSQNNGQPQNNMALATTAPQQAMQAPKPPPDRAAAADILFKTPENRLKWFQKVLPYLRSGKISNTVVFDALTHPNFATGLPLMIGRQLREMAMSNLNLFNGKQQKFLQSPANKLNDYVGDRINPAEQWQASGKDMMAGAAAIAAAFPSLAKAVAESSGITKPDDMPAVPPKLMSEAETSFHQQVQSMQKEREEEHREQRKKESGAVSAVAASFLTQIRSNAAATAASAEAAAVRKPPAPAKDISKMTDAELDAKLKRLKDPAASFSEEYDPEAPADDKASAQAPDEPLDLSKLSKEDLLKELEALRGDDGGKDDLSGAFDISRGAFIPGRQYKPACTYLPGQSPSPEREPRQPADDAEGRQEDPEKELKEKALSLQLAAPKERAPSREKKRKSRSRKRRRKSSSSSRSSPPRRKAKGGWDNNKPDIEALRAAQLAARMRVEAAVSGGAAGGASIGSPGMMIGPANQQPQLPSTVTFAGGGRNTQQGGADHNTLRAAQMKAATRLVYFPAGDSAPFREGDWMCPLCNAHNYRTDRKSVV